MADNNGENNSEQPQQEQPPPPRQGYNFQAVSNHIMQNKVEAALWFTRVFTIISCLLFMLPIFGGDQASMYQRALISNAATSALRLHQRLPQVQLTREFFGRVFLEDSAHYLFYSLIFMNTYPVTLSLVTVFLFALLHATNFTKVLLDKLGPNSMMFLRNLISKLEQKQQSILRFIACNEIFLFPAIVFMLFMGRSSLILPFVYYRFLTLRYASRRNPYSRQLFYELRVVTHELSSRPQCPAFLRNICSKVVDIICRLAPELPPDAARAQ